MASEKEASEESALEETALEETVVGLLKKKKMTLSLAESCTFVPSSSRISRTRMGTSEVPSFEVP